MQRSTIIYIIAGIVLLAGIGTGIYFLRQRSLQGLENLPPLINATSQQPTGKPKITTAPTSSNAIFIPAASGTAWNPKDLEAWKSVHMQYSEEEQKNLSASIHGEETLPKDVSQTWTPEFRAQMEAQQAKRR